MYVQKRTHWTILINFYAIKHYEINIWLNLLQGRSMKTVILVLPRAQIFPMILVLAVWINLKPPDNITKNKIDNNFNNKRKKNICIFHKKIREILKFIISYFQWFLFFLTSKKKLGLKMWNAYCFFFHICILFSELLLVSFHLLLTPIKGLIPFFVPKLSLPRIHNFVE